MSQDIYQLDAFNYDADRYDRVVTGTSPDKLRAYAKDTLKLKAWRIWNRTERAARDRLLPPVSAISKTFNHGRRFARVHKSPARRNTEYESYKV